ncbi:MAG: alginate lyase family protein [Planctomycetes bacterium]|nr:alginate lyase family protein [Planctomycetota bacterium]
MLDERHWDLLKVRIAGMERTAELFSEGRVEEARCHLISSARAAWTERWSSPRSYSLARLGETLDTHRYPQLASVARALHRETPDAARQFVEHLRQRSQPDASSHRRPPKTPGPDFHAQAARPIEIWQALQATGDTGLSTELDHQIKALLDPVLVPSWHFMNSDWAVLVVSALFDGGIPDEILCQLVLLGLDYAEHCNNFAHLSDPPQSSIGGNHIFQQIVPWLNFTILFPEFRRSPALRYAAVARLQDELSKQVCPDGVMIEGSPGYENCCIWLVSEILNLCRVAGVFVPPDVLEAAERMVRFAIGVMRPDGRVPMLGDSQDALVKGFAWNLKEFFSFPELDWLLSEGRTGHPPAFTSTAFRSMGYYVQRSGWGPEDLYLCFDGGRFGQAHHHEDKMHIELYAYGRPFLIDAGVHSYSDHWMRQWAVKSQAHNTLLVDGAGQCRWREDRTQWFSHAPLDNPWETGEAWDLVEAEFNGPYEWDIGPVRLKRRVLFHRRHPRFWWLTDEVVGGGPHEVTEIFHFAHDIESVVPIEHGVRTRVPGGPDLALLCLNREAGTHAPNPAADSGVSLHRGEQDPPRGWVSPGVNQLAPAWEVHFEERASLPLRRDFFILPWPEALPDVLQASLENGGGTSPRVALQVGAQDFEIVLPV